MVLPLINSLALFSLGYLLGEQSQENAPLSEDYQPPYTPPFLGGQCDGKFYLVFCERKVGGIWSQPLYTGISVGRRVTNIEFLDNNSIIKVTTLGGGVQQREAAQMQLGATELRNAYVRDGNLGTSWGAGYTPDECGDPPNPNPPIPTNQNGIADGGFNENAEPNTELAAPIVPFLPSFLAALQAALAAAAAAANALDGIKAVAEAIAAIADLLKKIRDDLNEKEKEKDKNKEILSYQFGKIEKDGFLRLYPSSSFEDCEAFQLDILITAIPLGYGKYFGRFSPNYFEYKRLGHIAFVSGSFGIIERKYIEFGRSSFSVPKGSVGFYYHLGLDGIIKANASAVYLREVEQIE